MSSKGEKKVEAIFILEVIGSPKEHLVTTLEEIIKKISEEKNVEVVSKKIHEPNELKDKKGFFTTYAEVEISVEELLSLAILMFKYMPAHIDILYPENINLTNNNFAEILNELTRRLHGYEELARVFQFEKKRLENKINELEEGKLSSS